MVDKVLKIIQIICMPIGTILGVYGAFFKKPEVIDRGTLLNKSLGKGMGDIYGDILQDIPKIEWWQILAKWLVLAVIFFCIVSLFRFMLKKR